MIIYFILTGMSGCISISDFLFLTCQSSLTLLHPSNLQHGHASPCLLDLFVCTCLSARACISNFISSFLFQWSVQENIPDLLARIPNFEQERCFVVRHGDKKVHISNLHMYIYCLPTQQSAARKFWPYIDCSELRLK